MGKFKTVAIFAAGYVFGARAGQKRYEQIKNWVQGMLGKSAVQGQVDKAGDQTERLVREAKEHLTGSNDNDKNSTHQGWAGTGPHKGANDSGQTLGSSKDPTHG